MMAEPGRARVKNARRTQHYRVLAGHMRLWAETEGSGEVVEELRRIAARLDQLAASVEAKRTQRSDSLVSATGAFC